MNKVLSRIGLALLALVVLAVAGLVVARLVFERYLHSEAFRQSLGEGAANELHASHADFSPLSFDGATVYGDNFHARRDDGGGFSTLDADQLRAAFDWHGLLHHTVQIDEMSVQRLDISPPVGAGEGPLGAPPGTSVYPAPFGEQHPGWKVDLRKAVINEANWHWAEDPLGGITGTTLTLTPDGRDAWMIDAQGGSLQLAGWPSLDLDSAALRWQAPILYINSSTLRDAAGQITATGSIEARQSVDLRVKLDRIDVQPLLTPDWKERLSGKLMGELTINAPLGIQNAAGQVTVSGSVSLADGQVTALPILDQIGTFTRTERFRQLDLTHASADFKRTPDRLEVPQFHRGVRGTHPDRGSVHDCERPDRRRLPGRSHAGDAAVDPRIAGDHFRFLARRLSLDTGEADRPRRSPRWDDLTPRLVGRHGQYSDQWREGDRGIGEKGRAGGPGFPPALTLKAGNERRRARNS